ncbi:MAG: multicopper oxidase domain-containing protein, partial [Longimicrobiales bacterium]
MTNHTTEMMQGLVMGVHVSARAGVAPPPPETGPRRRLRLVAQPDAGGTTGEPAFRYTLQDGASAPRESTGSAGPTIVVKRGEPVGITVVNQLAEATAVHWHGIELDSY